MRITAIVADRLDCGIQRLALPEWSACENCAEQYNVQRHKTQQNASDFESLPVGRAKGEERDSSYH